MNWKQTLNASVLTLAAGFLLGLMAAILARTAAPEPEMKLLLSCSETKIQKLQARCHITALKKGQDGSTCTETAYSLRYQMMQAGCKVNHRKGFLLPQERMQTPAWENPELPDKTSSGPVR